MARKWQDVRREASVDEQAAAQVREALHAQVDDTVPRAVHEAALAHIEDPEDEASVLRHRPSPDVVPFVRSTPEDRFPERLPSDITVSDIDLDAEEVIVGGRRLTNARAEALAERVETAENGSRERHGSES